MDSAPLAGLRFRACVYDAHGISIAAYRVSHHRARCKYTYLLLLLRPEAECVRASVCVQLCARRRSLPLVIPVEDSIRCLSRNKAHHHMCCWLPNDRNACKMLCISVEYLALAFRFDGRSRFASRRARDPFPITKWFRTHGAALYGLDFPRRRNERQPTPPPRAPIHLDAEPKKRRRNLFFFVSINRIKTFIFIR